MLKTKAWTVGLALLIREKGEHEGRDTREYTKLISFDIEAESVDQAADILRERLEPTCGDP